MTMGSAVAGGKVVALCGGIGGAKLAAGLARVVPPERLTIIINTGDDFRHLGLYVSPDIDTVTYTLAGRANPETGWGRDNESWRFMEAMRELGGPDWFGLGDTDLATKAYRSHRLAEGARLTEVTGEIARALSVRCTLLPATDDAIPTIIETKQGALPFQDYFVRLRWQPEVLALRLDAAHAARPTEEALRALRDPELEVIVLCPSNPYLSVDPILAVPGVRAALQDAQAPVIAVSPLVGGKALKGPLSKMMNELGLEISLQTIADHYADFIDILLADVLDQNATVSGPVLVHAQTVMQHDADRVGLAKAVLDIAHSVCGTGQ